MQTSRAKRLIKMLERLLNQDHLYNDEEIKSINLKIQMMTIIDIYLY